jgi:hypothetical protein
LIANSTNAVLILSPCRYRSPLELGLIPGCSGVALYFLRQDIQQDHLLFAPNAENLNKA